MPFGLANGGQIIVGLKCGVDVCGCEIERSQFIGLEPDAHGEYPSAQNVRPLDPRDRGKPRLNNAGEIVGNLVLVEILRVKTQIHRREFGVLGLDFDHRSLSLGRQLVSHLGDFRLDLGQGGVGIKV